MWAQVPLAPPLLLAYQYVFRHIMCMSDLALIVSVLSIHVLAWLTPGPQFLLILSNSLTYSRKTGIITALGMALGNALHIGFAILVTILALSIHDKFYEIIKYIGVAYLLFLAFKITHSSSRTDFDNLPDTKKHKANAFFEGIIINCLNPKSYLFFISVIGTVVSQQSNNLTVTTLAILMPINSLVMASLLALVFTLPACRTFYEKHQKAISYGLATALVILCVLILF